MEENYDFSNAQNNPYTEGLKQEIVIFIDVQVDFTTGKLANPDATSKIPAIVHFIDNFKGGILVFTQDTHGNNYFETNEGKHLPYAHCISGTPGHDIVPEVKAAADRAVARGIKVIFIEKPTFGFLGWVDVLPPAEQIARIKLGGFCTDICDISNGIILKAQYPEVDIELIEPLTSGVNKELHDAAVKVMTSCQIDIIKEV